jgi:hypothetical protein
LEPLSPRRRKSCEEFAEISSERLMRSPAALGCHIEIKIGPGRKQGRGRHHQRDAAFGAMEEPN